MDEEQLTREQERRMLELLEQAALHDYPNPDRVGCPGADFLKRLATNRKSIDLNDPALQHVAHCSPCYREFVAYRHAAKRRNITRRTVIVASGAAAATIVGVAVKSSISPHPLTYERQGINLFNGSTERGGTSSSQQLAPKAILAPKPLDLYITLPFASPDGHYELQVLNSSDEPTGLKAAGEAHIENGKTILHVRIDLRSLPRDRYKIGIRKVPFEWMPVPIQIR